MDYATWLGMNGGVDTPEQYYQYLAQQRAATARNVSNVSDPAGLSPLTNYEGTDFRVYTDKTGGKEDEITQLIKNQLGFARSRYNRLLQGQSGATIADFANALNPLQQQLGMYDSMSGKLNGLTDQLISASVASNAGAGVAAANAARLSGSGRYGGGGNAAIAAGRGAVDAAAATSAALSQALVQGRLGEANYQTGLMQQRSGVAAALSQLLQEQAGIKEARGTLGVAMENEQAQILGGVLQVYGGVGQVKAGKTWKDEVPSLFGLL